jgi:hypothetical protein
MGLQATDTVVCHGVAVNAARVPCAVTHAPTNAHGCLDYERLAQLIDAESVRLVVLPMVEAETGHVLRMSEVVGVAHALGCRVLVDTTCCIGLRSVDAALSEADFVVASGHGYLRGPPGVTACICRVKSDAAALSNDPGFCGVGEAYTPAAEGFSTLAFVAAFGSACAELVELGLPNVQHRVRLLATELRRGLESVPHVEVVADEDDVDADGIVSASPTTHLTHNHPSPTIHHPPHHPPTPPHITHHHASFTAHHSPRHIIHHPSPTSPPLPPPPPPPPPRAAPALRARTRFIQAIGSRARTLTTLLQVRFRSLRWRDVGPTDLGVRIAEAGVVLAASASALQAKVHYYNTVDEIHVAVDRISEVAAAAGGAVAAQEESDSDDSSVDEWVHLTLSTALPVQGNTSSSDRDRAEVVAKAEEEDAQPSDVLCDGGDDSLGEAAPVPNDDDNIDNININSDSDNGDDDVPLLDLSEQITEATADNHPPAAVTAVSLALLAELVSQASESLSSTPPPPLSSSSPETDADPVDDGGCPYSMVSVAPTEDIAVEIALHAARVAVSVGAEDAVVEMISRPCSVDSDLCESVASCSGTRGEGDGDGDGDGYGTGVVSSLDGLRLTEQQLQQHDSTRTLTSWLSDSNLGLDPAAAEYYPLSDDENGAPTTLSPFNQSWSEVEASDEEGCADEGGEADVSSSDDSNNNDDDDDDDDASEGVLGDVPFTELLEAAPTFAFDNPLFGASEPDERLERTCDSVESTGNSIEIIGASDFASECGECGEESIGGFSSDLSDDDADQHSLRASPANFSTSSAVSRPIAIRRTSAQARRGGRSGTPQSVSSSLGLHEVLAECERLSRTPPEFVVGSPPRVKEPRAFTPALSAPKLTWEDIRSSTPPPIRHSSSFTAAWASGRTSGKSAHHNTDENVLPPQICRSL